MSTKQNNTLIIHTAPTKEAGKKVRLMLLTDVRGSIGLCCVNEAGQRLKTLLKFHPDGRITTMGHAAGAGFDTDSRGRVIITHNA